MNVVVLKGNLTRDPESRAIRSGDKENKVCNFSIAVNRKYKTKSGELTNEVVFVDCEAWDRGGESITTYFKKGDPILIHGALKLDQWEKDGQQFSRLKVRVNEFEFVNGKKDRQPEREVSSSASVVPEPVSVGAGIGDVDPATEPDIPF